MKEVRTPAHSRIPLPTRILAAWLFLLATSASVAQDDGRSIGNLTVRSTNLSARTAALAGATVGAALDVSSVYDNPAALLFSHQVTTGFDHRSVVGTKLMDERVTIPLVYGWQHAFSVGFSARHEELLGTSSTEVSDFFQYGLHAGYAGAVATSLSLGARLDISGGEHLRTTNPALAGAVGVFYHPFTGVSYGAVLDGIGDDEVMIASESTGRHVAVERPLRFQFGASMRFPTELRPPVVVITVANGKDLDRPGLHYKGGIELWPIPAFAARAGYGAESGGSLATVGVGFRSTGFSIDYAASLKSSGGRFHQLSLTIEISNRESDV